MGHATVNALALGFLVPAYAIPRAASAAVGTDTPRMARHTLSFVGLITGLARDGVAALRKLRRLPVVTPLTTVVGRATAVTRPVAACWTTSCAFVTAVAVFGAATTPRPILTLRAGLVAAPPAGGVRCAPTLAGKILFSFTFRCAYVTAVPVCGAATTPTTKLTLRAAGVAAPAATVVGSATTLTVRVLTSLTLCTRVAAVTVFGAAATPRPKLALRTAGVAAPAATVVGSAPTLTV